MHLIRTFDSIYIYDISTYNDTPLDPSWFRRGCCNCYLGCWFRTAWWRDRFFAFERGGGGFDARYTLVDDVTHKTRFYENLYRQRNLFDQTWKNFISWQLTTKDPKIGTSASSSRQFPLPTELNKGAPYLTPRPCLVTNGGVGIAPRADAESTPYIQIIVLRLVSRPLSTFHLLISYRY